MSTKQIEKEIEKNNKELEKSLKKEENLKIEEKNDDAIQEVTPIKKDINQTSNSSEEPIQEFAPVEKEKRSPLSILGILIFIRIYCLAVASK